MTAWIESRVFEAEIANLAEFEARVDVAVDVVLLFRDFNVLLGRDVHLMAEVGVCVQSVRIDVPGIEVS